VVARAGARAGYSISLTHDALLPISSSILTLGPQHLLDNHNSIAPVNEISTNLSNRMRLSNTGSQKLQLHVSHTDVVQNS
jgi:hypothetical protein